MSVKRFALLVGINYFGTDNQLNGCVNDITAMKLFLAQNQGLTDITVLTDDPAKATKTGNFLPTKANILRFLTIGVSQMKSGDTFYFHYSGHGSQVADQNRDEKDGLDEVLVPADFMTNGFILDDDLRAIVNKVPTGARFIAVIDACNSETSFDLKYLYDPVSQKIARKRGLKQIKKAGRLIEVDKKIQVSKDLPETAGEIICLSGCKDNQTSADAFVNGKYQGALTAGLLATLAELGGNVSLEDLPMKTRQFIMSKNLGTQIPRLTFGRADFQLTKKLF